MKNIKREKLINKAGIYCIMNIIDEKIYVGSSINLYDRLQLHRSQLRRNVHGNRYLQRAYNKHGLDNFFCYILEETTKDKLLEREDFYIKILNADYNLIIIPSRYMPNDDVKLRISNTLKRKYKSGEISSDYHGKSNITLNILNLKGEYLYTCTSLKEFAKKANVNYYTVKSAYRNKQYWIDKYILDINGDILIKDKIILYLKDKKDTRLVPMIDLIKNEIIKLKNSRVYLQNNPFVILNNQYCLIGVNLLAQYKQGELLENPEEDNQQPSLNSNVFEGSTTNIRVLLNKEKDSNNDTSALPLNNPISYYGKKRIQKNRIRKLKVMI